LGCGLPVLGIHRLETAAKPRGAESATAGKPHRRILPNRTTGDRG
jgi:hypothetical protein